MAPASFVHRDRNLVCVMDAASPFGVALVRRLLRRGYTVHAAAFNTSLIQKGEGSFVKGLTSDEMNRMKIFRVDPFDYHSIVDAIAGCAGLFYSFEPSNEETYDEYMVEMEVRTAHNVLEACAQTETMERVVFSSSVTAVVWKDNRKLGNDFDERDWSDPNFCRKYKLWHALAKTLAERTAWALAMDRDVDMVTINSGLTTGVELSLSNPYLKGSPEMYKDGVLVTADINFLVDAHIAVYESPSAYGRYLCFNETICSPEHALKLAKMLSPNAPSTPPSDELKVIQPRIENKKLNKIMVDFDAEKLVEV